MTAPPDHLVCAFPHNTVTGQEQYKFIGGIEIVKEESHAAVGDIDHEAVAWWNSRSGLDLRHAVEAVPWRPASLRSHQQAHWDKAQVLAASTLSVKLHSRTVVLGRLTSVLEFTLLLFEIADRQ
jgi:hypothetical protein